MTGRSQDDVAARPRSKSREGRNTPNKIPQRGPQSPVGASPAGVEPQKSRGRFRDPVEDALEMKRKQAEAQQALLRKREEQELAECTFAPAIDYVSRELAESNPYRRSKPLHERGIGQVTHVWAKAEPHYDTKVHVNETSRQLVERLVEKNPAFGGTIGDRAKRQQQSLAEWRKKEAEQKEQREGEEATHAPSITKSASKLVQQRSGPQDALGRLTDEYVRKQQEARDRAKVEAENRMAKENEKTVFVNKTSERLLQQAVESGRQVKGIDSGSKTPRSASLLNREARAWESERFDFDASSGLSTPIRGSVVSRQPSGATPRTPRSAGATPRASTMRTTPPQKHLETRDQPSIPKLAVSRTKSPHANTTNTNRPRSPAAPQPKSLSSPRNSPVHTATSASTTSRLPTKSIPDPSSPVGAEVKAREMIYSSDPNSVSKSGSDVKWQARMSGKAGTGPSPTKLSEGSRNSRTGPGFNPLKEMERMRQEFQTLVAEKEEQTKELLAQVRTQTWSAENSELETENERLRNDLESQMERVAELESAQREANADRDMLRKTNEKLRLDLEAITEKGQAVVELNAKLTLQIKALKAKLRRGNEIDAEAGVADAGQGRDNAAIKKQFEAFLDSEGSSPEQSPERER